MKDRIVIFGGTFNPPTRAHLDIATEALYYLDAEKVLFVPVSDLYKKDDVEISYHRVNMLNLAIGNFRRLEIDFTEVDAVKLTYTYETVEKIKSQYQDKELFLLIGADNLEDFKNWKNQRSIMENCSSSAVNRNNSSIDEIIESNEILTEFKDKIIEAPIEEIGISSTEVRNRIASGELEGLENLVDKEVIDYIIENKLYSK